MNRIIGIKIIGLTVMLIALNFIYNFTVFPYDLEETCIQVSEMKERQPRTDIFYFAESSDYNSRPDDSIQNRISEMTNFFFPKLKITTVTKPGAHAGIYRYWLTHIDVNNHKPKAIVVTLNLRSFGAAWINSDLETAMQESIQLLRPYPKLANRFLLSLNAFDDKTVSEREKLMLEDWKTKKLYFPYEFKYNTVRLWDDAMAKGAFLNGQPWDDKKIGLSAHYIKGYAFNLDASNPRVRDFDFISQWCHKNGIKLYLNLMAENIQYADSLVGKELVFLMKNNRDYFVKRYTRDDCVVIDNLELLGGKEFSDQTWTTEHYGYKGRMLVARKVANKLKKQFSNEYKKAY